MRFNVQAEKLKASLGEAFKLSEWIKLEAIAPATLIVSSTGAGASAGVKIEIFAPVEEEGECLINRDLQVALSSIREDLIIADHPIRKLKGRTKSFGLFVAYSKGQITLNTRHDDCPQLPFEDVPKTCASLTKEDITKLKQISCLCEPKESNPLTQAIHLVKGFAYATDSNVIAKVQLSDQAKDLSCAIPVEVTRIIGAFGADVKIHPTANLLFFQCESQWVTARTLINQGEMISRIFDNLPNEGSTQTDLEEWENALSPLAPLTSKIAFTEGVFTCPVGEASVSSKLDIPLGFVAYRLAIALQLLNNKAAVNVWTDGSKLVFSESDRSVMMQLIDPDRI